MILGIPGLIFWLLVIVRKPMNWMQTWSISLLRLFAASRIRKRLACLQHSEVTVKYLNILYLCCIFERQQQQVRAIRGMLNCNVSWCGVISKCQFQISRDRRVSHTFWNLLRNGVWTSAVIVSRGEFDQEAWLETIPGGFPRSLHLLLALGLVRSTDLSC